MKTIFRFLSLILIAAILVTGAFGQIAAASAADSQAALATPPIPTFVLPTYVGFGAAANQLGTSRWNLWGSAIYPLVSSAGVYTSSTVDAVPVQVLSPAGQKYWTLNTSIRQGAHKDIYQSATGKFHLLLGGDGGLGIANTTNLSPAVTAAQSTIYSFTGSLTATALYQFNKNWGIIIPIRGMYNTGTQSHWYFVPEFGVLFKP